MSAELAALLPVLGVSIAALSLALRVRTQSRADAATAKKDLIEHVKKEAELEGRVKALEAEDGEAGERRRGIYRKLDRLTEDMADVKAKVEILLKRNGGHR